MKMIEIIASDLKETLLKDVALKYYEYLNKNLTKDKPKIWYEIAVLLDN